MTEWSSFVDVLGARAAGTPERLACRFLSDDDTSVELSYAQLDRQARVVARRLGEHARPGDRALLLFEPGLRYVEAFFGCLYAGVVAVPAYPPMNAVQVNKLASIIDDAKPAVVIGTPLTMTAIQPTMATVPSAPAADHWLAVGAEPNDGEDGWSAPTITTDTVAFLQYTSGTTDRPKGVVIDHSNLLANSAFIALRFGHTTDSSGVIWLPPYHDMGLIGGILQPVYSGFPVTLMSPLRFLRDPAAWLDAIGRYGGTTSGGPNFAYDLCLRKIPTAQRAALDLSTWSVAFIGAEPVHAETMRAFSAAFAPSGFDPRAFFPCYGMAEATLMVSGAHIGGSSVVHVDADEMTNGRFRPTGSERGRPIVGCGSPAADDSVVVVDAQGHPLADGHAGEIWVSGAGVARGYWGRADDQAFAGRLSGLPERTYLQTGDLGVRWSGELFPIARLKDAVQVRGRNYAPNDIETSASAADPRLRPGGAAAFTVDDPSGAAVWIVLETSAHALSEAQTREIADAVRAAVARDHGLAVQRVFLVRRGHLPKTSSGKVQRRACRAAALDGSLDPLAVEALGQPLASVEVPERALLIRALAAEVIGVAAEALDPYRALTSLGLDSVGAVRLRVRLQTEHGLVVELATLLGGATCTALAAEANPVADKSLTTVEETDALTSNESAMWFLQQLAPDSRAYHLCHAVDVHGPIDRDRFHGAIGRMVERHEAFRTTFPARDGCPARVVADPSIEVRHLDADGWDDERVDGCLAELSDAPIDLAVGPLWRIWHLERGPDQHIVAICAHHIVADLWALTIVGQELIAALAGEEVVVNGEAATMRSRAAAESAYLNSAEASQDLSTWTDLMAGVTDRTDLPTDHPRGAVQTFRGATVRLVLDEPTTCALRAQAQRLEVTPYAVLLTSLYWLLHKYTGSSDLVVGAPATGRTEPGSDAVVGMMVNTIPLRARLGISDSFDEAVRRSAKMLRRALSAQRYPLAELIRQLPSTTRDASRNPLFDIVLAWQQSPGRGVAGLGLGVATTAGLLQLSPRSVTQPTTPFDLAVDLIEDGPCVVGRVRFNEDLWDKPSIEELVCHWQHLLAEALAGPDRRLDQVRMTDPAEISSLMEGTAPKSRSSACHSLDSVVSYWAGRTPGTIAVEDGPTTLTYGELEARVSRGAAWLAQLGVGAEVPVGLLIDRSSAFVVAALTVLRAGGTYVPLDPVHPVARLASQIRDANSRIVLTDGRSALVGSIAKALGHKVPRFIEAPADPNDASPPSYVGRLDEAPSTHPDRPAYIMYTSGTTGTPKGVCVPIRGVRNLLDDVADRAPLRAGDRCAWWTSAAFDLSVYEVFAALDCGGTVAVVPEKVHLDGPALVRWIAESAVAAAYVPLFALGELADFAEERLAAGLPLRLRRLTVGVEPVPGSLLRRISDAVPGIRILNAYGPTEATIISALCDDPAAWSCASAPIGGSVSNNPLYVLDAYEEPVPLGVVGEIYVGGMGVARGYLGRPRETAAAFLPDPWRSGGRMYRTGDHGRWDRELRLRFAGRRDRQVKLRGVRIELGEIESVLRRDPRVSAAVVAVHLVSGQDVLVGYVVGPQDPRLSAELIARARRELPSAMVPTAVTVLDRLPMTSSGKLDRRALQPPDLSPTRYEAPQNAVEQAIIAVWSDALGGQQVGRHDDFFALGGHSLLAARAAMQLSRQLARDIQVSLLFAHPTAAALSSALATGPQSATPPLAELPRAGSDEAALRAQILALPDAVVAQLLNEGVSRS